MRDKAEGAQVLAIMRRGMPKTLAFIKRIIPPSSAVPGSASLPHTQRQSTEGLLHDNSHYLHVDPAWWHTP